MVQRNFDRLRSWDGEQSRAFEELSYQLLKGDAPRGSTVIRTGNPDGGVEWYAVASDGAERGWQAKHVAGIEALLTTMTDSVRRVARERPQLRRLTFVISWNLSTGTSGGKRKSQRQKYEDKVASWKTSVPGAEDIEFDLVQGSDLLDRLATAEHLGREWFWFDQLVLGPDWLARRFSEQADTASQKYRPDLQVDVPIQDDLVALGFGSPAQRRLEELARAVVSAAADVRLGTTGLEPGHAALCEAASTSVATIRNTTKRLAPRAETWAAQARQLVIQLGECRQLLWELDAHERRLRDDWRERPSDERDQEPPSRSYSTRELLTAAQELQRWLEHGPGRLLGGGQYLLTGGAGSGKTHLLLDATRRALDDGGPAVFLSGSRFGSGDLWASIADQLGLPARGADELLLAMDAAGEASAIGGRRFLIFVDALNETAPPEFWTTHLPALRARVAPYPHVALAVSCRDTYLSVVADDTERQKYVARAHPGFAEREVEATASYFAHYGLDTPRIPLLLPEFTTPLFLRLYCESLEAVPADQRPSGHQGRIAIFERYLDTKLATVARRSSPGLTSAYELERAKQRVRAALDSLLNAMIDDGAEVLEVDRAEDAIGVALGPDGDRVRLLGLLQEEGVLTQERLYLGDNRSGDAVRVVFQAFSDHLLLERRLDRSPDPLHDRELLDWLVEGTWWGATEAATLVFPERYGVELPDLLNVHLGVHQDETGRDERDDWKVEQIFKSLVRQLPHRNVSAISQRTVDLLNEAQMVLERHELYGVLATTAPQPGSRLNGEALHRYLVGMRMPYRDHDFGIATYDALDDGYGPFARLARWAASGPYPAYDDEVVELACVPLCWLFSSPNRYQRDWVTKALVQLLHGHLDVARALLDRFWPVDDPYVVQRVVAVAHGALLRSSVDEREAAGRLAIRVLELVFCRPVRPDELLLDSARGIVRWAVGHGLLATTALETARRPYGLVVPGNPPREEVLREQYARHDDESIDPGYATIYYSIFGLGDFGRYVVESGLRHFSRYRTSAERPPHHRREPRVLKKGWSKFVRSLDPQQLETLSEQLQHPGDFNPYLHLYGPEPVLTPNQLALLEAAVQHPKVISDDYPAERAQRWIFRRTLSLGWTPDLFGWEDRRLSRGGAGREGHKAERWGKKYQWMAYHELLARVADNYQSSQRYNDSEPYEGLHDIIGEREIDPSLAAVPFEAFAERSPTNGGGWLPGPVHFPHWPNDAVDFHRYGADVATFLADRDSEPTPTTSLWVEDQDGDQWVVLDGWVRHGDPHADKSWLGLQQHVHIESVLVPAAQASGLLERLKTEAAQRELSDAHDSHGHTDCCFAGEIGRAGAPRCPHRHEAFASVEVDGEIYDMAHPIEGYTWEGSLLDCSIEESATAVLPSTFVQDRAHLTFDVRGPSWILPDGRPGFVHLEHTGTNGRTLLARASVLSDFMRERGLSLVVLHNFERNELKEHYPTHEMHKWVQVSTAALLNADLHLHVGTAIRTGTG